MTTEEMKKKAEEAIQVIERAIRWVEDKTIREVRTVLQKSCSELEQTWDQFFSVHDKDIQVSPIILLAKATNVGNTILKESNCACVRTFSKGKSFFS